MKPHGSPARESRQTSPKRWLRVGLQPSTEELYWNSSADLLFVARPSFCGHFVYESINPAFESRLGVSSRDVLDMDVFDCLSADDARSVCEALRASLAEKAEIRIRQRLAFGGSSRTKETTVTPILDPATRGVVRLIGCHREARDVRFEDATTWGNGLDVEAGLLSLQESIQQRIASDLHDSTCQHLIAASLGLMRIRGQLDGTQAAERICDEIDASIDEALRELRAFAYLLHPRDLTGDGLKATIEGYAEGFAARTSLHVRVNIVPEVDGLPYEAQRSLLRVVQEALTNVFRHAKATEVAIVIDVVDSRFQLMISDNGRGLPHPGRPGAGTLSSGVGIPAMRARLHGIGGTLAIQSNGMAPHSGTVLSAVFPHVLAVNRRNRRRTTINTRPATGTRSAKEH
ncbi:MULTISPECIES: ATP-binding protein [unclassified Bradyrhizobium]|uniref:sensor histidine kinase n=1 Tax=unclassified Bradyrhizobium TaxID=2631580 RepID=UPI001CD281CB